MSAKISLSKPSKHLSLKYALEEDNIQEFTYLVEQYLANGRKVVLLNSGTAAIHLALILSGIKEDDEVMCQTATFSAAVNPIIYQKAIPVFVGSEQETWNMCPIALEVAIKDRILKGKKPKAIIVVHLYGMPSKIDQISAIANKYKIYLIEDAAEAFGAVYKGQKCGTYGDFGILSFNTNKIMTTFGGGALVCKSEKHQKEGLFLATQAKNSAPHYEHSVIGFNYVMSDLLAGVGREQMEYLEKYIALRRLNNVFYENIFKQIPGITLLKEPNSAYFSTHWLSCILIDPQITSFTSKELRLHLEANNIESRPLWKPMHLQPIFSGYRHYGSDFSEYIFKNGLCLPSSSNLQETDKKRIFTSIQEFVSEKSLHTLNYSINKPSKISEQATLNATLDLYIQAKTVIHSSLESNLKRRLTFFENPVVASEVNNKVVLVTGAAGSIGSEISRQLSSYNLELLILIDQAESPLYDLQQELLQNGENSYGENSFKAVVADVRDYKRMEAVFAKYKPQKVFHAAAYKHVPLMENSPYEAVKINICGTKNIADLSLKYEVERFVMVSTDKAVNPSNVMGATKRVAELYVSCLSNEKSDTKFTITRFGNVLGSNGSVIPLFKKQIENGGPLTLTHKDITRYFMTISEACRLVLEASIMGDGGETYIFDMGKSVKIFDLAKRIIFLSGFAYPEEIDIKITGLRPGEKLHEELLASGAHTIKTSHKKIRIASSPVIAYAKVKKEIIRLTEENRLLNDHTIVAVLKEIVPEYISNNSIFENLDKTSTR